MSEYYYAPIDTKKRGWKSFNYFSTRHYLGSLGELFCQPKNSTIFLSLDFYFSNKNQVTNYLGLSFSSSYVVEKF